MLALLLAAQDPARSPQGPLHDDAALRRAVAEVFARDDLRRGLGDSHATVDQTLLDAKAWLLGAWVDLQRWLLELAREQPALYWLLLVGLLALLGLLLWHLIATLRGVFRAAPATRSTAMAGDGDHERVRRYDELHAAARAAASAGAFGEAVRTLALALLALLEERRVLHVARGWTIREILARVRTRTGGGGALADLERLRLVVERATFGGAAPADLDFRELLTIVEQLAIELGRGARGAAA